jgi:hypothetical protein
MGAGKARVHLLNVEASAEDAWKSRGQDHPTDGRIRLELQREFGPMASGLRM